jgi:hypothetical protein
VWLPLSIQPSDIHSVSQIFKNINTNAHADREMQKHCHIRQEKLKINDKNCSYTAGKSARTWYKKPPQERK